MGISLAVLKKQWELESRSESLCIDCLYTLCMCIYHSELVGGQGQMSVEADTSLYVCLFHALDEVRIAQHLCNRPLLSS